MTEAQIKFYGRRWGQVCQANQWQMDRGRLVPQARLLEGDQRHEGDKIAADVTKLAKIHAAQNSRAINVEDLRRACVGMVTGTFSSAKDLTNPQFDRLLILFRILIDPDDLDAIMEWSDPKLAEEQRLIRYIKRAAPDAYTLHITKDRWGTIFWEDLPLSDLKQLSRILAARNHARAKRSQQQPVEEPF